MPKDGCGRELGLALADQIVGDRQHGAEKFTAAGRAVLRQGNCFEDEVSFGEKISQGLQFCSVRRHTSMVRGIGPEGNRSLFFVNALFRHYQRLRRPS